jgi:hypothetical protein
MLQDVQDIDSDPREGASALEIDSPQPAPPTKAASLTGALVQRGRERAPRMPVLAIPAPAFLSAEPEPAPAPAPAAAAAAPLPTPTVELAPVSDEVPLVFNRTRRPAAEAAPAPSRWSEVLFVAACCAAFFATFLFVLRF